MASEDTQGAGEAATSHLSPEPNAQTQKVGGPRTQGIHELAPTLRCSRRPHESSFPVEGARTLSNFLFFCRIPQLNYLSHFTEQKWRAYSVPVPGLGAGNTVTSQIRMVFTPQTCLPSFSLPCVQGSYQTQSNGFMGFQVSHVVHGDLPKEKRPDSRRC